MAEVSSGWGGAAPRLCSRTLFLAVASASLGPLLPLARRWGRLGQGVKGGSLIALSPCLLMALLLPIAAALGFLFALLSLPLSVFPLFIYLFIYFNITVRGTVLPIDLILS